MGTGIDLIEINRIDAATKNDRFNERVFTAAELLATPKMPHRLAGFFAAKEALLKAMGTGLNGFNWLEIEIGHNEQGAPYIQASGKVKAFLTAQKITRIHLSISHGKEYAVAQVILESS